MTPARGTALLLAGALALAGCGGGDPQDANEAEGRYQLDIVSASFPEEQSLAQAAKMKIAVRNTDDRTVPQIAVTVKTDPGDEGAPQAFAQRVDDAQLADPSRPIWIVDSAPEGATVAHTNTWALPRVAPGETAEFEWEVTAVKAGDYTIDYEVFPGLDGKATLADGGRTEGSFTVSIDDTPPDARVNAEGEVVRED
jgi:hypothetical protein